MTAAETYAARIDAVSAQRLRLHGYQPPGDRFGGPVAQRFRSDPHRSLDANLQVVASYVQPDDVLIDVGGGAGRVGLPLALRCRQVINVDASPGMLAEFEACAAEAGITNARSVLADWLAAADISGNRPLPLKRRGFLLPSFRPSTSLQLGLKERSSLGTVTGAYKVGLARRAHPLPKSVDGLG